MKEDVKVGEEAKERHRFSGWSHQEGG